MNLPPQNIISVRDVNSEITVNASVGFPISVFGYSSPQSKINLTSSKIEITTTADNKGYFQFNSVYINPQYKEICLAAIDRNQRSTNPVCVPSPNQLNAEVGPVLLPPTISLDKTITKVWGESLPETEMAISIFNNQSPLAAYAFTLPQYTIKTDKNGYYSFNLPSNQISKFRIFAQTTFNNSPSPISNTLSFEVRQNLLYPVLIVILILIITGIILIRFKKRKRKKKK